MWGISFVLIVLVLLSAPVAALAQYDPYFGTYDTPYVDYSSPTWTKTPDSVIRGTTGGTTGGSPGTSSGSTSGTSPSAGATSSASITIPADATEVWVQPGPDPRKVFYPPDFTVEEPRALADTTLRKIYVRSPLGKPDYTKSVGAFDTYNKGYVYTDKLSGTYTPPPSVAPTPPPAKPVPAAPTTPPVQPIPPVPTVPPSVPVVPSDDATPDPPPTMPDVVQQVTTCGPNEKCGPVSDTPTRLSPVRRIARGIHTFFSGIIRWFQRL